MGAPEGVGVFGKNKEPRWIARDPAMRMMRDIADADVPATAFMDCLEAETVPEAPLFSVMFAKSALDGLPDGWPDRALAMLKSTEFDARPWIQHVRELMQPLVQRRAVRRGDLETIYAEWTVVLLGVLIVAAANQLGEHDELVPVLEDKMAEIRGWRERSGAKPLPLDGQLPDAVLYLVERTMMRENRDVVSHLRRGQWASVPPWDAHDYLQTFEHALAFAAGGVSMAIYHLKDDIRMGR